LQDRGAYAAAALTIVRGYLAAGRPDKLKPLVSYEAWSDLVRSALVWLGCADPVDTMAETRASDPVLTTLRTVLDAWQRVFGEEGRTAQQAVGALSIFDFNAPDGEDLAALRAALAPVAATRGIIDASRLSYWLRKSKGRPVDGLKFVSTTAHGGAQSWKVTNAQGA
jgi:putative DNA primase/helicase